MTSYEYALRAWEDPSLWEALMMTGYRRQEMWELHFAIYGKNKYQECLSGEIPHHLTGYYRDMYLGALKKLEEFCKLRKLAKERMERLERLERGML